MRVLKDPRFVPFTCLNFEYLRNLFWSDKEIALIR